MLSLAGSTSTLQNSCPNTAFNKDDLPALTSPTTTKSKGSARLRERVCKVSTISALSSVSLARETKFPTTPPSRARASRYASTTMDTIVILLEGTLGQCWLWEQNRKASLAAVGTSSRLRKAYVAASGLLVPFGFGLSVRL